MANLRSVSFFLSSLVALSLGAAAGCGGGEGPGGRPGELVDNGFESDDPTGRSRATGSTGGATADAGVAASATAAAEGDSAKRAIEEADIVKVDGTRLYALSRYGGLSIIDVSNPDAMKLVGRKRTDGVPFEMYVRNGKVHVMLNDFGRYVRTNGSPYGQWVQSSEVAVLDVQNPSAIDEVAHYDVPGSIADSRLVGDVLYLVTFENGYCWGCQKSPATIVTSFNLAGAAVSKVDSVAFSSANSSSWRRSVSATNQRLYVAGPEWNWQPGSSGQQNSIIQVVDIADPSGALKKGADVPVAGQINSRWQMDEHEGVLRVVSQFGNGRGGGAPGSAINPKVQTFTVASSTSITPLGSTELVLPKPEMLQSVRFDGPRAYAITSERTDPLFTIDLSNPAAPKQAGELEMPGWIFHMEPRGDRLVGFGYSDTASRELAVSLFDVSNLATPKMLQRVSFGSDWSSVAEDKDRIHKSVRVIDEEGLILVPFASYGRWGSGSCSQPQSGIQLIDYSRDSLKLRGLAPQHGLPRRALVTGGRLLAMSDRTVTSFDIAGQARDAPVKKHEIDLSNPSYRSTELQNHVASITNDWWTGAVTLALVSKTDPDDANVTGKISLESLAPASQAYCNGPSSWTAWYQARIFGEGNYVYVTVPVYDYSYESGTSTRGGRVIVAAIDASNPAAMTIAGKSEIALTQRSSNGGYYGNYGFWDGYGYYSYYGGALVGSGEGVVKQGTKLAYLEVDYEYVPSTSKKTGSRADVTIHRNLHVVDFAVPASPAVHAPIDLGESLGVAPLHLANGVVHTSRWIPATTPGKVRFFVDRVDINGTQPALLASINAPGSLLSIDAPSNRWVTTDYAVERAVATDWSSCNAALGRRGRFDYASKDCYRVSRSFKLSDVSDTKVSLRHTFEPSSQNIGGVVVADDRIYVSRYADYEYSSCNSGGPCTPTVLEQGGLWAIGGIRAGTLSIVSSLDGDARWPLAAHGTKVALYTESGIAIYDTVAATPTLLRDVPLRGYGYTSHVVMNESRAVCSLGEWGLQTVAY